MLHQRPGYKTSSFSNEHRDLLIFQPHIILDQTDTNISKNINILCFENNLRFKHISAPHKQYSVLGNHSNPLLLLFTLEFLVFVYEMSIAPLLMLSAIFHFAIFCMEELGSHFFKVKISHMFYVDKLHPSF